MAITWVVIAVCYFLPSLIFISEKLGLDVIDTRKAIGVEIEFKANWYPIMTSNIWPGKIITPPDVSPAVFYCKINWISPWSCDPVVVSRSKVWDGKKWLGMFVTEQQFPWGTIGIVKDDVTKTPDRKLGLLQGANIGFSGIDLDILNDIKAIHLD